MEEEIKDIVVENTDDDFNFDVLVSEKENITVKVRIVKGVDPTTNKPKMIVYRTSILEDNIKLIDELINGLDSKVELLESNSTSISDDNKKEINLLKTRKIKLELDKMRYQQLLDQPYKEWSATFKCPNLSERVSIESRSFTENAFGEKSEFNEFENIRAKCELLLVSWEVKNKNKIVPVKDAIKCDPDLLKAFTEEFDVQSNGYLFTERKK